MKKLYECQTDGLTDYLGTGNAPADYDEYWRRAKNDLKNVSLRYELAECGYRYRNCEAFDLYFTGVGGARIHCQFIKPKHAQGKMPALVQFHGYWGNCGEWTSKLNFVEEGFCVLAMDVRGQGGESEDNGVFRRGNTQSGHVIRGLESENPDNMFYRNVFLDAAQCALILMSMEFVDEKNVFAMGGSQGGALAAACASLVSGLNSAAVIYPFLCDFRGIYRNNFSCPCYEEITWYFRQRDPMHEREEFFFDRLGYIDIRNRAKDIKCDILWFTALSDRTCPPFSQLAAYNGITSSKKIIYYPEYGHEWLEYSGDLIMDHFLKRMG